MKTMLVRYQTKPDRAEENIELIAAVFAELNEQKPAGFTYTVFRFEDGNNFMHVVSEQDEGSDSLAELPSFQAFQADIASRCEVEPRAIGASIVGDYR